MRMRSVLVLAALPALFAFTGCSGHKPRPIDITKGEYYEGVEYEKLSKKDREAYCRALATELDDLQDRAKRRRPSSKPIRTASRS